MNLCFVLSMPGCNSWNGRWSGEGELYAIIKKFTTKKAIEKAEKILSGGYYHYNFGDGWAAGISVTEVDSADARKIRRKSRSFAGYDWMVNEILECGEIRGPSRRART